MIHKLPTNKRSVLGWLCRREMRQNLKKKKELSVNPAKIDEIWKKKIKIRYL